MHPQPRAFTAPADATRWQRRLLYSPLARLVIFVLMLAALSAALFALLHVTGIGAAGSSALSRAVANLLMRALPAVIAYLLLVKLIERRAVTELAPRRALPDIALGVAGGLVLFSAVIGVLWLAGSYHVIGVDPAAPWLPALLGAGLGAGIGEEIITRGALFRMTEEGLGTAWALGLSAAFFGFAHMFNPGATLWSSLAIAVEAGLLFGMLYHVTRSLWPCMGLHAAWNFAQGSVYGVPVSGLKAQGWLVSTRSGPDWLSGGVFGAEASVIALALCLVVTAGLIGLARRRGSVIPRRSPLAGDPINLTRNSR